VVARDVASTPHLAASPAAGWHSLTLERSMVEDVEVEDPMWSHRSLAYDRPDEWHREFVHAITGLWSWKVGPRNNIFPEFIAPHQDAALVSPAIRVFPGGKLSFKHRYTFLMDEKSGHEALDGGIVQWQDVDRDGPSDEWFLIDPDGGYPFYISYASDSSIRGWPGFAGTVAIPEAVTFTFPSRVVNRTIRLRFRVVTTTTTPQWPGRDGWIIDDIVIDPGPPPTAVTLAAVAASRNDAGVHLAWSATDVGRDDFFIVTRRDGGVDEGPEPAFEEIARIEALPERSDYEVLDAAARPDRAYIYRVALRSGGAEVAAQEAVVGAVRRFLLHQNVPNPFNPTTRIAFEIPARGHVVLAIHDVRGRLVRRLVDAVLDPGRHDSTWDGTDSHGGGVASGVYLVRLESAGRAANRRLVLLR
jgi:hypothetical protein